MPSLKKIGIWMDHASAHCIELTTGPLETRTITSTFTHNATADGAGNSEHVMHNKEQHQQVAYYKELGELIKTYEEVLLFGPTDAKTELYNLLQTDHHFDRIKIKVEQADKMTENQQHAFVREHLQN